MLHSPQAQDSNFGLPSQKTSVEALIRYCFPRFVRSHRLQIERQQSLCQRQPVRQEKPSAVRSFYYLETIPPASASNAERMLFAVVV